MRHYEVIMTMQATTLDTPGTPVAPEGKTFQQWMDSRCALHKTRRYDWNALKFQADFDPKYRRAQMRYLGTGGTGVAADTNALAAEHFTFSTMIIPAGNEGPMHLH